MDSKFRPPTLKEIQNYAITIGLGLLIAFFVWYASYVGWFIFNNPPTPFVIKTVDRSEAIAWETLKKDYPHMLWPDTWASTQVYFNISTYYWDEVLYPKNLFVFRINIKNTGKDTLWYPTILIFIVDSSNYVRGKHLLQLWSEDDGIESNTSKEYIFYFNVPQDMKAQNFFIEAILYGMIAYNYPQISVYNELPMYENDVYGRIPNDYDHRWFISRTERMYHSYPSVIPYVFQVSSIATNTVFIIFLATMVWISERIKAFLGTQYGFYFLVIVFTIIFFLLVFLLNALLF